TTYYYYSYYYYYYYHLYLYYYYANYFYVRCRNRFSLFFFSLFSLFSLFFSFISMVQRKKVMCFCVVLPSLASRRPYLPLLVTLQAASPWLKDCGEPAPADAIYHPQVREIRALQ